MASRGTVPTRIDEAAHNNLHRIRGFDLFDYLVSFPITSPHRDAAFSVKGIVNGKYRLEKDPEDPSKG